LSAPQPVVQDNLLIDARTGQQFVPRGINWTTFEYACAQGWGYSELDAMKLADPAQQVAAAIHSWNANTVRLPLNQDCWLGTRSAPVSDAHSSRNSAGYRAAVRAFVQALNAQGMVVVLDLQSRKVGSNGFGNVAMPDAESLIFWGEVAAAYASAPSVLFDAFNEPYSYYDQAHRLIFKLSWQCWRDGGCRVPAEVAPAKPSGAQYTAVGMTKVVAAIRGAGARQPILLGGLRYSNDMSQWLRYAPSDGQLVAAFHSYDFTQCAEPSCWDSTLAPLASRVPVLTSELGADNPTAGYVSDYLAWADRHNIGVLFWAWGNYAADPMALTSNDLGTPSAYGELARGWLRRSR
jgi:hypothetical protein